MAVPLGVLLSGGLRFATGTDRDPRVTRPTVPVRQWCRYGKEKRNALDGRSAVAGTLLNPVHKVGFDSFDIILPFRI